MFSGTISGLLGEWRKGPVLKCCVTIILILWYSLRHLVHERSWWPRGLEMGELSWLPVITSILLGAGLPKLTFEPQLFILEGIPAILCGIYTFFFLPNCECNHPYWEQRRLAERHLTYPGRP